MNANAGMSGFRKPGGPWPRAVLAGRRRGTKVGGDALLGRQWGVWVQVDHFRPMEFGMGGQFPVCDLVSMGAVVKKTDGKEWPIQALLVIWVWMRPAFHGIHTDGRVRG